MSRAESLRPMMLVGTGSGVGKSLLATGLCRIFHQQGFAVAPFKAQNMSLNSSVTADGSEIGRAQWVQALAAGVEPSADHNPVLLKPSGARVSQLILNGRVEGNYSAAEYFGGQLTERLFAEVLAAFERLRERHSLLVIEGAGSISELNLRSRDIVNMPLALAVGARVYLVADIDRGGVFGSVYGNLALLSEEERGAIAGVIINRFRGDLNLFDDGRRMLEDLTGVPVVGVVPWFDDVEIDEEDSQGLLPTGVRMRVASEREQAKVVVVRLPHIANYTDFSPLQRDDRVELIYSFRPEQIESADAIILPGSKNTIADLDAMRSAGIVAAISRAARAGRRIVGICGGLQMMGESIEDPDGVEGCPGSRAEGLALLPLTTQLLSPKVTLQRRFRFRDSPIEAEGYEIHMGRSDYTRPMHDSGLSPLNTIVENGAPISREGWWKSENCFGTYIHSLFDHPAAVEQLLDSLAERRSEDEARSAAEIREENFDRLAEHLRVALDLEQIYRQIGAAQ